MGEFLKGWRRKMGCVTLVMACVFTAAWVRSLTLQDCYSFGSGKGDIMFVVCSREGAFGEIITFYRLPVTWKNGEGMGWEPGWDVVPQKEFDIAHGKNTEWRWKWAGFDFFQVSQMDEDTIKFTNPIVIRGCLVPYWTIVIPLTLVSTYLLLVKPRPKPKKAVEPTNIEGT